MDARIIHRAGMTLVGMATNVTLREVQDDKTTYSLANAFMNRQAEISLRSNIKEVLGLSTDPERYDPDTDEFEFFIGVEVSSPQDKPAGMIVRTIPANHYVAFTFKGTAEKAGAVHAYLYSTWLKENEFELSGRYNIEVYDERNYGPESEESVTDILFPIQRKQVAP